MQSKCLEKQHVATFLFVLTSEVPPRTLCKGLKFIIAQQASDRKPLERSRHQTGFSIPKIFGLPVLGGQKTNKTRTKHKQLWGFSREVGVKLFMCCLFSQSARVLLVLETLQIHLKLLTGQRVLSPEAH